MEALQYIYTSWKNGDSREKGYMIYSRSEGITEEECTAIKCAMQYLPPKNLTPDPTPEEIANTFPYSFAYFMLPTGRGCVAQSTYLGKDYSGRFGNYIIYALVFDVDDLPCRPTEFFAESYIKTVMTEEELNAPSPVPPLPPLQISEYGSVINDEQIEDFLFEREDTLAQLISMILAAREAGVPFYLNDTRENLVLWCAAVQKILPFQLAKKFTFNTYIGDHESMQSDRARKCGLDFYFIGVRPDANYFEYALEYRSNRHIVMDLIGGYMTEGVALTKYAKAMAASIAFDGEDAKAFNEFISTTSFDEISVHLDDAYLYYQLLKKNEFDGKESSLKAILEFGNKYCSEADNAQISSKILDKYRENSETLELGVLGRLWLFVCKYETDSISVMYDLFTEMIFQHASEVADTYKKLDAFMQKISSKTPTTYKKYVNYLNTDGGIEILQLYIKDNNNLLTNEFYVKWLIQNYAFECGLTESEPVSRLMLILLDNIVNIWDNEKQIVKILLSITDNRELFMDVTCYILNRSGESLSVDRLCSYYLKFTETTDDGRSSKFERLLTDIPEAEPIVARLCDIRAAAETNNSEDVHKKESISKKLGSLFRRKQK